MKLFNSVRLSILSLSCAAVALAGCGSKVLDFRNVEIVNGKVYATDANSPFSGKLTNVPMRAVIGSQHGFFKVEQVVESASVYAEVAADAPVTITHLLIPTSLLCDVHVSNGALDGDANCMNERSDIVLIKMSFDDGLLNGPFQYYSDDGKTLVSGIGFREGEPDGTQKVYSPSSGNLLLSAPWIKGVRSGTEKAWYGATGKQAYEGTLNDDGKLDGKLSEWSPDGTLVHQASYANGQKDGAEETFFADTGKIHQHTEWANGKENGFSKTYDQLGNVVSSAHYVDNRRAYTPDEIHAIARQQQTGEKEASQRADEIFGNCLRQAEEVYARNQNQSVVTDEIKTRADAGAENGCRSQAQDAQTYAFRDVVTATGGFAVDACIDGAADAYQKSQPDALITESLLNQWQLTCGAGKTPD